MSVTRHQRFGSYAYDLGIYDQALWLISNGIHPYVTVRELHILGDHFTPILYLLAPIYWLENGTEFLLIFQTIALASGALPLYLLASRGAESRSIGLLAGITYLAYPALRGVNLFDFHPIALATPCVLFALDFAERRKAIPFSITSVILAMCKQEAALMAAALGVWYAIRWRQPRALSVAVAGAVWLLIALSAQARLSGSTESAYAELYSHYGHSTPEIVRTFLLQPWVPLGALSGEEQRRYLFLILAPLALLPICAPRILWLALIPLTLNLFSNRTAMREIDYQYTSLVTPVLFAAAATALAGTRPGRPRRVAACAWAACAFVAALSVVPRQQRAVVTLMAEGERPDLRQALATIPPAASVSATQSLVPHLAHRKGIYLFPNPFWPLVTGPSRQALRQQLGFDHPPLDEASFQNALRESDVEYLVLGYELNLRRGTFPLAASEHLPLLTEVLRSPAYGVVHTSGGLWILKRGADHIAGLKRLGLESAVTRGQFRAHVSRLLE